ncbi:MAG: DUF1549 and DUF1553 domain-containing protein [Verrucomicrobiota bacterium]
METYHPMPILTSQPSGGWLSASLAAIVCLVAASAAADTVSFRNDVMPVISKAGCNMGSCHGNLNGKGGFKLSLRAEDLEFDLNALARDFNGRRLDTFNPDESLILLKATTQLAHEGGLRFAKESPEYAILRQWIADGARTDAAQTPRATRLDVTPPDKILFEPADKLQLQVKVTYSNDTQRDLTTLACYEPVNTLVKVTHDGLVERQGAGESIVLVRYQHLQVPVRIAFLPARADFKWKNVPKNNYVDDHVFDKLKAMRIQPSDLSADPVFLRRAYLDLLGILPTADEARAFLADKRRDKRARLIDQLLERPEFADFWALKWSDLLRNEEKSLDRKGVQNFHFWIRESIAENKPVDQFVRELISARGSTYSNPAANFYRANRTPVFRAQAAAQVFLGTRLQCAECHNHPYERWTQDDYYNWTTLFARVNYKILENRRRDKNDKHEFIGEQIVFLAPAGEVKNPRTGKDATPRFLGAPTPDLDDQDRLEALAQWVASPNNSLFVRAQVNRIWYHLMGRGLVDPVDDLRDTNLPSHPALMDALAKDFVARKFDLRHLIRVIMNSRTYQLSSTPNESNGDDEVNYSHVVPRRLTAEQLIDSQSQATGTPLEFNGYPKGIRAAQIPGVEAVRRREQRASGEDAFLKIFGRPPRLFTSECERSCDTTMTQAFQLISGPTINALLTNTGNRLNQLAASDKSPAAIVDELYWTALTRPPTRSELEQTTAHIAEAKNRRQALEDVAWALLNAKEFILRH